MENQNDELFGEQPTEPENEETERNANDEFRDEFTQDFSETTSETDPFGTQSTAGAQAQQPQPEKKRKFPVWQIGVAAIAFGLIAGIVFQLTSLVLSKTLKTGENVKIVNTFVSAENTSLSGGVADIVSELMPAMVSINVVSTVHANNGIFSYEYQATGAGSGVIFGKTDTSLFILTNYHVINGADSIAVNFVDNTAYYVSVRGYDEATDLAVLEIKFDDMKDSTMDAIRIAVFGSSADLQLGEQVIAIGNALGYGQTVTVGYVSALNRNVTDEDGYTKAMIQTDAAINAGNSGGALINSRGEIVGINSMKNITQNTDNIGYAIPIDTAKSVIREIMERMEYSGDDVGFLGITGAAVSDVYYDYSKRGIPAGVYVDSVAEGLPAAKAGIQAGDVITAFNGKQLTKMSTLQTYLTYKTSGDTVVLTIQRKQSSGAYQEMTVTVTLISKGEASLSE